MTDNEILKLNEQIEYLVEWELDAMDYTSLQDYFYEAKIEYYHNNPNGLQDMLQYRKELMDTEIEYDLSSMNKGD
jgi:hypothetical protein